MTDLQVQSATGTLPDGTQGEFVHVPEGHMVVLIPEEVAEEFKDWRECAAVRIVQPDVEPVGFVQVAADLDELTAPEQP